MKEYKNKIRYYFYIMENIETKERRITSVHNCKGIIDFRKSKKWNIISDNIIIKDFYSDIEYREYKKILKKHIQS